MTFPETVARCWRWMEQGELLVGGLSVSAIAERHGTPLFVYDSGIVRRKYDTLRDALPASFHICYSVKANPNPAFLRFFVDRGCGLEIASAGELHQALSAGCSANRILFAGPGKTESELRLAIAEGIAEIHAESALELDRISRISQESGLRTRVALRINPSEDGEGGAMRMGGKSAPFGVDEEEMDPLLLRISNDPFLEFGGIHLFAGTQILDHRTLLAQYRKALDVARRAAEVTGSSIPTLDLGGGLGIPYFNGDSKLNLDALAEGLRELAGTIREEHCFADTKFVVEPGRYLSGECGVYVARIIDIKTSRSKKYLILDGGMNHHLAASGNLGQVIRRNFPMALINKLGAPASETVDVVGPLCTPLDTSARSAQLPRAEIGDLVGIFQAGAYARTASPLGFLSHPTPPEIWVEDGRDIVIRRRGSAEDYLRDVEWLNPVVETTS